MLQIILDQWLHLLDKLYADFFFVLKFKISIYHFGIFWWAHT